MLDNCSWKTWLISITHMKPTEWGELFLVTFMLIWTQESLALQSVFPPVKLAILHNWSFPLLLLHVASCTHISNKKKNTPAWCHFASRRATVTPYMPTLEYQFQSDFGSNHKVWSSNRLAEAWLMCLCVSPLDCASSEVQNREVSAEATLPPQVLKVVSCEPFLFTYTPSSG